MQTRLLVLAASALPIAVVASAGAQARRQPVARTSLEIHVTDRLGHAVPGVEVVLSGPADRSGQSGEDGALAFLALPAGTYRSRFTREGFITLERDLDIRGRGPARVEVALSSAPALPPPPPPPEPARLPSDASVQPRTVPIPEFIEQNFVGRAARKDSLLGCTPSSTTTLLQLREPLGEHSHADADEMLYVVAGEALHKIVGRETKIEAGTFCLVPRGTIHAMTRRGSNPIVVLSIQSGTPCTEDPAAVQKERAGPS